LYYKRTWYRQKKPYNLPLNFTYIRRSNDLKRAWDLISGDYPTSGGYESTPASVGDWPELYSRVYNEFKEKLGHSAALGTTLAEGKQAMGMITNRLVTLAKFANSLRKLHFRDAAEILGSQLPPKGKRRSDGSWSFGLRDEAKWFSNNFLEFHFGWKPLVQDIYDAAETLSDPIPAWKVEVRKSLSAESKAPLHFHDGSDEGWSVKIDTWKQTISMRSEVSVSNPNLALASSLGLTNPAAVAWELVPFSFVLDWFVNVGDFLESFTDFAGLTLINPNKTTFTRYSLYEENFTDYNHHATVSGYPGDPNWRFHRYPGTSVKKWSAVYLNRVVGSFPGPTLTMRAPWRLSPSRGLAAASLLVQRVPAKEWQAARPVISRKQSIFRGRIAESYWHL
jgi:hypothetical protein